MKTIAKYLVAAVIAAATALHAKEPVPAPSQEAGTIPPDEYTIDYYAPPTDWWPQRGISEYTQNTRVPDLFWLKYDGAYTMALRIKPIAKAQLEKDIAVGLIAPHIAENNKVLEFTADREKEPKYRTITVDCRATPGDDFTEFSFKMKATTKNPNPEVKVIASGVPGAVIETTKHLDAEAEVKDGFKSYKIALTPRMNAKLQNVTIVLPPAAEFDPNEEYVFFDLHLKRKAPRPRFTDLPQRQWIRKTALTEDRAITSWDGIKDIVGYINTNPGDITSYDLPISDYVLREQTEKDKDNGFTVEETTADINGKTVPAVKITITKGDRCYLKFPIKADGSLVDMRDFNTMSFYSKIELFDGVDERFVYDEDYPVLYGTDAGTLNSYFDTFSFGVYSKTYDYFDWNKSGVSQGLTAWNRQRDARTPEGWQAIALDVEHSDRAGNKGTYLPEISHWCFFYNNKKIPEGKKVVVTIASPKLTSGLMHAGGSMELYKKFLKEKGSRIQSTKLPKTDAYTEKRASERLAEPLPLIRDHIPQVEIIVQSMPGQANQVIDRAINYMQETLKNKYGLARPIPVLRNKPSKEDNVKLFVGGGHFRGVDKALYDEDQAKLRGTAGFAIRTRGKNIYFYADPRFNFAGEARGLANAVYFFLENNTDEMPTSTRDARRQVTAYSVFGFERDGNADIVWPQDYIVTPPVKYWNVNRGSEPLNDRFSINAPQNWDSGTPQYGGYRCFSVNHWWGYGAFNTTTNAKGQVIRSQEPNEKWGLNYDGKRMLPGCYTGHPCLINVLEDAKADYLGGLYEKKDDKGMTREGKSYVYQWCDIKGLWVEDTLRICQCEKCLTPIRLANGSLVDPSHRAFRSVQFFANGCAMIHAVNVHANRNTKVESIGYFWMSIIPLFEVSKNYNIRFCPYIRKNYAEPIYAPANDLFWRDYYRWSQLGITLSLYEYFLQIGIRPWTDTYMYDLPVEAARGLEYATPECDTRAMANVEAFAHARIFLEPDANPQDLRRFYIRRVYREAAPAMEKFYTTIHNFFYKHIAYNISMEFDGGEIGALAWVIKSDKAGVIFNSDLTVAEELNGYLEEAKKLVEHPISKIELDAFCAEWDKYIQDGKKSAEKLKNNPAIQKPVVAEPAPAAPAAEAATAK